MKVPVKLYGKKVSDAVSVISRLSKQSFMILCIWTMFFVLLFYFYTQVVYLLGLFNVNLIKLDNAMIIIEPSSTD